MCWCQVAKSLHRKNKAIIAKIDNSIPFRMDLEKFFRELGNMFLK